MIFAMLACTSAPALAQNTWSGFYIGANIGDLANHDSGTEVVSEGGLTGWPYTPTFGKFNSSGLLGGVQVGYNWQWGNFVVGPELDYDGSAAGGHTYFAGTVYAVPPATGMATIAVNSSASATYFQTERLRIGYAVSPSTMVYITAGTAQSHWNVATNFRETVVSLGTTESLNKNGWAEGAGLEWTLAPRVTVKAEGLYYDMEPQDRVLAPVAMAAIGRDFYFRGTVARVGVNWRL